MPELSKGVVFHFENGNEALQTCTVAELQAFLAQFSSETPVLVTYEGVVRGIHFTELQAFHHGLQSEETPTLFIDAEQGW